MTSPAVNIFTSSSANVDYYTSDGGPWVYQSTWQQESSSFKRQRGASVSIARRPDHTRPPGSWSHHGGSASAPIGELETWSGSYGSLLQGVVVGAPSQGHLKPEDPALVDAATQRCLEALKGNKINLGVSLAQARETAGLVGSAASSIAKSFSQLKKGKLPSWERFRHGLGEIPAWYLEWCYGVVPLMSDVYQSAETLADYQTDGYQWTILATGRSKRRDIDVLDFGSVAAIFRHFYRQDHSVQVTIRTDVPTNSLRNFTELGLTNPLSVAWEVVPYSFVVDWFLPIGGWLNALDAGSYLNFIEGSVSYMRRGKSKVLFSGSDIPGVRSSFSGHPGSLSEFEFRRTILGSVPLPPLPRLRSPLSLDKMAKGLALLTQAFR